ncbi:MAG: hypothetical protein UU47_C0006G0013 [candidate division TM6 bacterium GW2011_GWE2_41_16]|nr:MAG: hypothetical protein UU47_C0006G0013 [candidate division TM6 bacterium GW2011_GWE2_41_16]
MQSVENTATEKLNHCTWSLAGLAQNFGKNFPALLPIFQQTYAQQQCFTCSSFMAYLTQNLGKSNTKEVIQNEFLSEFCRYEHMIEKDLQKQGILCGNNAFINAECCLSEAFETIQYVDHCDRIRWIGDIHANYKKLESALNELKKPAYGMFDQDLHLKPGQYIVFTGDYGDRGNYDLEVLTLLLKLANENPHQVFLCRGNHEDPSIRQSYCTSEILKNAHDPQNRCLLHSLNKLYSYLPHTVYLGCKDPQTHAPKYYLFVHGCTPSVQLHTENPYCIPTLPTSPTEKIYRKISNGMIQPSDNEISRDLLWNDFETSGLKILSENKPNRGICISKIDFNLFLSLFSPQTPVVAAFHGHDHHSVFEQIPHRLYCGTLSEDEQIFATIDPINNVIHKHVLSPSQPNTYQTTTYKLASNAVQSTQTPTTSSPTTTTPPQENSCTPAMLQISVQKIQEQVKNATSPQMWEPLLEEVQKLKSMCHTIPAQEALIKDLDEILANYCTSKIDYLMSFIIGFYGNLEQTKNPEKIKNPTDPKTNPIPSERIKLEEFMQAFQDNIKIVSDRVSLIETIDIREIIERKLIAAKYHIENNIKPAVRIKLLELDIQPQDITKIWGAKMVQEEFSEFHKRYAPERIELYHPGISQKRKEIYEHEATIKNNSLKKAKEYFETGWPK